MILLDYLKFSRFFALVSFRTDYGNGNFARLFVFSDGYGKILFIRIAFVKQVNAVKGERHNIYGLSFGVRCFVKVDYAV